MCATMFAVGPRLYVIDLGIAGPTPGGDSIGVSRSPPFGRLPTVFTPVLAVILRGDCVVSLLPVGVKCQPALLKLYTGDRCVPAGA